jgi:hypothetical protein
VAVSVQRNSKMRLKPRGNSTVSIKKIAEPTHGSPQQWLEHLQKSP